MALLKPLSCAAAIAIFALSVASSAALAETGTNTGALQGLTPLNAQAMNSYAGGTAITGQATSTINQLTTGNTIGNIGSTGGIDGISMNAVNGISTVIANSGNQVSIAESTTINLTIH